MQVQLAHSKKRRVSVPARENPKFFLPSPLTVEHAPEVISDQEFIARWWPGDMQVLTAAIPN
ncbi:MAG: hypothetical protein JWM11_5652 [Planctomycetaceae bacterium]|nr:hypothetical protein [Planctomycetaceae bacterium]